MALLLAVAACSSGDYSSGGSTPAPAPSTTAAEVSLRGVVAAVFASARVVTLAQPVGGISHVALTDDTQVVRADGAKAGLGDIAPRSMIEAVGRAGTADTMVARRLVLL